MAAPSMTAPNNWPAPWRRMVSRSTRRAPRRSRRRMMAPAVVDDALRPCCEQSDRMSESSRRIHKEPAATIALGRGRGAHDSTRGCMRHVQRRARHLARRVSRTVLQARPAAAEAASNSGGGHFGRAPRRRRPGAGAASAGTHRSRAMGPLEGCFERARAGASMPRAGLMTPEIGTDDATIAAPSRHGKEAIMVGSLRRSSGALRECQVGFLIEAPPARDWPGCRPGPRRPAPMYRAGRGWRLAAARRSRCTSSGVAPRERGRELPHRGVMPARARPEASQRCS
jgi:hypothetical protein